MARAFLTPILLAEQLITTLGATMASGRILGRSTADVGAVEELTVGSRLTLAAGELNATTGSVTTGITGATQVANIVQLTQANYDAITSPSATTLYVITP
jgi:hypothetical protein